MTNKGSNKKKTGKGILRRIGLVAVAIYFCFTIVDMQIGIDSRKDELIVKEQKLEEQRILNKDAERRLEQARTENEIERIARENGYGRKDEIYFKDSSGN